MNLVVKTSSSKTAPKLTYDVLIENQQNGGVTATVLGLPISQDTYQDFFSRQFIQDSLKEYQIKLLIFNSLSQDIVLWKE